MEDISKKRWFNILTNSIIAFFAIILVAALFFCIKNLPENLTSAKKTRCINTIVKLARKGEPFTLRQAIKFDWDEAKLITYQYDTGFGANENDDYYCNIRSTFNSDYHILVLYKDKKYVVDFSFNKLDNFAFADSFETLSADTLLKATKQENSDGYILSIK